MAPKHGGQKARLGMTGPAFSSQSLWCRQLLL